MLTSQVPNAVRLLKTYTSPEAQRFALEPLPYGAGWPEVADVAEIIFVYEFEPHEPGAHFYLLLTYNAEGNEVGRKRQAGWDRSTRNDMKAHWQTIKGDQ